MPPPLPPTPAVPPLPPPPTLALLLMVVPGPVPVPLELEDSSWAEPQATRMARGATSRACISTDYTEPRCDGA